MNEIPDRTQILRWLHENNPDQLDALWRRADEVRRVYVGDAVHLRGLVEISNHCVRKCAYCGLRVSNRSVARYRLSALEILDAARKAAALGCGTVVLQSGEDPGITVDWLGNVIRAIKSETALAVTLSLGERSKEELAQWRQAGADRYLLRFETSDPNLFNAIHPARAGNIGVRSREGHPRIAILRTLRRLGFETGSGIMVGIPGQSIESIAEDISVFRELNLDMIGIGPFIPHPATPLGGACDRARSSPAHARTLMTDPELMAYKTVALSRLVRPDANIPATTALATINKQNGRELGLRRGANVVMPNCTPLKYRKLYEIYPAKACIDENTQDAGESLSARLQRIGRHAGSGSGRRNPFVHLAAP